MTAATDTVGAVVQAARDVVAVHRGPGDLSAILDGLDRLDESLKVHDAAQPAPVARARRCPHDWYDPDCKCGLPPPSQALGLDLSLSFGWTGCPAELACLHYLLGDQDEPARATALCRACSKAHAKRTRLRAERAP